MFFCIEFLTTIAVCQSKKMCLKSYLITCAKRKGDKIMGRKKKARLPNLDKYLKGKRRHLVTYSEGVVL